MYMCDINNDSIPVYIIYRYCAEENLGLWVMIGYSPRAGSNDQRTT